LTITKVEKEAPWSGRVKSKPTKQGVCHIAGWSFTLNSIIMQKKNYENLYISPFKNIVFKKIL
jgi:hypothetical protein